MSVKWDVLILAVLLVLVGFSGMDFDDIDDHADDPSLEWEYDNIDLATTDTN